MRRDAPSVQAIQDYLKGLNRTSQAWLVTVETAACKQKGIDCYLRWFREHGIEIHQDLKSQRWELGTSVQ